MAPSFPRKGKTLGKGDFHTMKGGDARRKDLIESTKDTSAGVAQPLSLRCEEGGGWGANLPFRIFLSAVFAF